MPTVIGLPEPGTPAAEADIRLGDRLEAVDGQATAGLDLEEVTSMVRGPVGEQVTLSIRRPDATAPHVVRIVRAVINVESVLGDIRGPDGSWNFLIRAQPRIGYVRIRMFGDKTAAELAAAVAELSKEPLAGLVIDVRDDAGGSLDAAVQISDLFLRAGRPIVTTRDRDEMVRDQFVSTGAGKYVDLPLAVLVDRNSASASEIVAAALQDYDRATVIGERSYGKGTVQRLIGIEAGRSLLKLTSATYWRPSGKNIHKMPEDDAADEWGVSPDPGYEVKLDDEAYELWRNYRLRRDLMGEGIDPSLAEELSREDGKIPADFRDEALERAIEHLESRPVDK
jgi:carboxyl-terminal processing protease